MARKQSRSGQRKGRGPRGKGASKRATRLRWLGALVLLAIIGSGWGWWVKSHWQPPRAQYPVQGV